jgi:hypothetical protein
MAANRGGTQRSPGVPFRFGKEPPISHINPLAGRSVEVVCGSCGGAFELSDRNARRYRTEGRTPICSMCRRPPPKPMSTAERERLRRWWLEESGLTRCELVELAAGLVAL